MEKKYTPGREIKFRANIKGTPIILEGFALYDSGMIGMHPETLESQLIEGYEYDYDNAFIIKGENRICEILEGDEWIWIESKNIEITQFTGLKDKNDKAIYEGDILKGTRMDITCIASYDSHSGGFYAKENDLVGYRLSIPKGEYGGGEMIVPFEVIGNIYEKPELIK